jgi:hypothetical protein
MKTRFHILSLLSVVMSVCALAENGSGRTVEEGTVYVPIGKRDPFKRPSAGDGTDRDVSAINPLEKFNIEQFQLRAILRGSSVASAMFEDPEGRVHILSEGTLLGRERGTISRILNREVIITERTVNYLGVTSLFERVLSLPADDETEPAGTTKAAPPAPPSKGQPGAPGASTTTSRVIRSVTEERAAAPPPAASNGFQENRNFPGVRPYTSPSQTGSAPPPPPPPPTTIRGGEGNY